MKNLIVKLLLSMCLSGVFGLTSHAADSIFCGDSRTIIMYQATHDNDLGHEIAVLDDDNVYWTAKHGMGYDYFVKTCIPLIEENIEEGTKIYINMGVNDCLQTAYANKKDSLYNYDNYVKVLAEKTKEWTEKGAEVYYVNLMPITTQYYDKYVVAWNYKMERECIPDLHYIDIYNSFNDYTYIDGDDVHLDWDCSRKMYEWIPEEAYRVKIKECTDAMFDRLIELRESKQAKFKEE